MTDLEFLGRVDAILWDPMLSIEQKVSEVVMVVEQLEKERAAT